MGPRAQHKKSLERNPTSRLDLSRRRRPEPANESLDALRERLTVRNAPKDRRRNPAGRSRVGPLYERLARPAARSGGSGPASSQKKVKPDTHAKQFDPWMSGPSTCSERALNAIRSSATFATLGFDGCFVKLLFHAQIFPPYSPPPDKAPDDSNQNFSP